MNYNELNAKFERVIMNKQKAPGFTLLEVMIVVAILGIVASIAVPSYQNVIERNSLKQVIESFKADLQLARTRSIKESRNVRVNRTTGNAGAWCYGLTTKGVNCSCTQTTSTAADFCEMKRILGTGFRPTDMVSATGNSSFDFRRGTIGPNGVTFSTANYASRVVFSSVGRIRICSPSTVANPMPAGRIGLPTIADCS